jgi:DNA polymerase-3 subunit gamma/tau
MSETRIETYIPLYRKYRPQSFADVVGQEAIVQTLGNAIRLNKVAHAYLFCGPRGTGKTSTARIFAKSLNCEHGPTVTPCQQCASCTGIASGNALDVVEFDAASNNGVGDARELIENCQYSSMTGRFKVYIIDEVHMLTPQAFNALLKTLEEPPANVIFIFATTEAHKVLPTIISRCQRFDFNRITTENIVSRLRFVADQEHIAVDEEALLTIARHARGGLRDAVGLLDQVAVLGRAQQDKTIGRKDVALFIGALEEDLLLRLGSAIAERRAADLLAELSELLNRGIEPIQLLKELTLHFRNLLVVNAAGPHVSPEALSLPPDYFAQLVLQAQQFPEPEEIPQIIGRLAFVERNIRNSNQPQLWLEVGLIELAYRHEINRVKDLSDRLSLLEAQLSGQKPNSPQPIAAKPAIESVKPQSTESAPIVSVRPTPQPQVASTPIDKTHPQPNFVAGLSASEGGPSSSPTETTSGPQSIGSILPPVLSALPAGPALEAQYQQACALIPSLPFRSLLQQQTFPISLEGDALLIGCVSEAHQTTIKKPDKLTHLQRAVEKVFGHPLRVEVVLEKKRPAGSVPPVVQSKSQVVSQSKSTPVNIADLPLGQANPSITLPATTLPAMQVGVLEPVSAPVPPNLVEPLKPTTFRQPDRPSEGMPPIDESAPPMLDDEAPMSGQMEEGLPSHASGRTDSARSNLESTSGPTSKPSFPPHAQAITTSSGDPDLAEAKKHALELLQGRLIE